MKLNNMQIAVIAVAVVLIVSVGGYMYWQNTQKEAQLAERYQRWVDWSRTLYVGSSQGAFHPGLDLDSAWFGYFSRYLRGGKLHWIDPDDGAIENYSPYIAESWEYKVNDDGEAYIEWKIKPGLKFPDGTPVTSEAVQYSWNWAMNDMPNRETHGTGSRYFLTVSIDRVECPDELTAWHFLPPELGDFLPEVFAGTQALGHGTIVSPTSTELYAKETNDLEDFANQVGWGPCLLESWQGDERYTLVPWEDFPENPLGGNKGPTKITQFDKIVVTKYGDPTSMRMALEAEELDIAAQMLLRSDLKDLEENPKITVDIAPMLGYCQVFRLNYNFPPLNDTRVRKAINLVVEPEEIVDKVLFGTGVVANSVVRPFQPYFLPVFEEMRNRPIEERINEAKQLMVDAGYPNGFDTEFWYYEGEQTREMATILQAQLSRIGINIEIKSLERAAYYEGRNEGHYPMCFRGWTLDYNDPNSELWYQLFVSYGPGAPATSRTTNVYGWDEVNNTKMSKLLERGLELYDPLGDPPEREEVYHEIQQMLFDESIVCPIYYDSIWHAYNNYVEDFKMWKSIDMVSQGLWNAHKIIPDDWETREPPV